MCDESQMTEVEWKPEDAIDEGEKRSHSEEMSRLLSQIGLLRDTTQLTHTEESLAIEDPQAPSDSPLPHEETFDSGIEVSSPNHSESPVTVKEEVEDDDYENPASDTVPSSPEPQDVLQSASPSSPVMSPDVYATVLLSAFGFEGALAYASSLSPEAFFEGARLLTTAMTPEATPTAPKRPKTERKPRENYEKSQQVELEKFYAETKHPTMQRKTEIASKTGLTYHRVQKWFENRRQRDKRVPVAK
ncbi:hypothetical protein QR680_004896 [Steinernema hermaphroditum]|uniref:Homeobox domain-containing protein n=1 Tax=Steinernema hermaphroditum TaxID=289476 RepID=A0AA39HR90_9BILA|nr:hypothetical protein QR680_004896 [Steinernema hermaphroditum]